MLKSATFVKLTQLCYIYFKISSNNGADKYDLHKT